MVYEIILFEWFVNEKFDFDLERGRLEDLYRVYDCEFFVSYNEIICNVFKEDMIINLEICLLRWEYF